MAHAGKLSFREVPRIRFARGNRSSRCPGEFRPSRDDAHEVWPR